jgi:hypothetical protein
MTTLLDMPPTEPRPAADEPPARHRDSGPARGLGPLLAAITITALGLSAAIPFLITHPEALSWQERDTTQLSSGPSTRTAAPTVRSDPSDADEGKGHGGGNGKDCNHHGKGKPKHCP